jgi:hypothetical protein
MMNLGLKLLSRNEQERYRQRSSQHRVNKQILEN